MARTKSVAPPPKPRRNQLVQAANLLRQASDPTRLSILLTLDEAERNVGRLVEDLGLTSPPVVSRHLALLRHSGLAVFRREGHNSIYSLTEEGRILLRAIEAVTTS